MQGGDVVLALHDGLDDGVSGVVVKIGAADERSLHGDGGAVLVKPGVGTGGQNELGVPRAGSEQLFHVRVVKADHVHGLGGGELGNGRGRSAGAEERGVDLAVLEALGAVTEGLVHGGNIVDGHVVGGEHIDGVEVRAAADVADAHALAAQVFHGLERGIGRDDLHRFGIQSAQNAEAVDLAGVGKGVRAVVGVGHNVGLDGRKIVHAVLHAHKVILGAAGRNDRELNIGLLSDHGAEDAGVAVIGAALTAGADVQRNGACRRGVGITRAAAAGAQREHHAQSQNQSQNFFHFHFLLFILTDAFPTKPRNLQAAGNNFRMNAL